MQPMRIFIAFPVSQAVQQAAAILQAAIAKKYPFLRAKWVPVPQMHVTLEFVGSTTEEQLEKVREVLVYQTKRVAPFLFETGLITAFPDPRFAHTLIWEIVEQGSLWSKKLHDAVHEELVLFGTTHNFTVWRPHITLARIKRAVDMHDITSLDVPSMVWEVGHLDLLQSLRSSEGSSYTVIDRYLL